MEALDFATIVPLLQEERNQLHTEKKRILKQMSEGEIQSIAGPGKELIDCTTANNLEAQGFQKLKKLESAIQSIEHALKKIPFGQFGICQQCDEPIGPKRLLALPCARFCRWCQREIERKNHSPGKTV